MRVFVGVHADTFVFDGDDDAVGGAGDGDVDVPGAAGWIGMANGVGGRFADGQGDIGEEWAVSSAGPDEGVDDAVAGVTDGGWRGRQPLAVHLQHLVSPYPWAGISKPWMRSESPAKATSIPSWWSVSCDLSNVERLDKTLEQVLSSGGSTASCLLDLSAVTFMDSSVVNALVRWSKETQVSEREGLAILVGGRESRAARVLTLVGLIDRLPVFDSVDAA